MVQIAIIVLAGHWLDLYIMILPTAQTAAGAGVNNNITTFPFGVWEIGLAAGGIGVFLLVLQKFVNLPKMKIAASLQNTTIKSSSAAMSSN